MTNLKSHCYNFVSEDCPPHGIFEALGSLMSGGLSTKLPNLNDHSNFLLISFSQLTLFFSYSQPQFSVLNLRKAYVSDYCICILHSAAKFLRIIITGLFYVDQEALRGSIEAKLAVSPLYLASIGSLSFPFLSTHHCFGVFYMIRTIRSFPTHRPCISVYISSFQRWSQFSVSIPCFRARFTA
jgi:hypothetical protein